MATVDPEHSAPIWEQVPRPNWIRAVNAIGRGARRLGRVWPRLTPGLLLADARRRTRLDDFGDDSFREGLRVLIDAFNARDAANSFGRFVFQKYCTGLLINRLKIQDELKRHPEILDVPVPRPLIILGLPRSGTTFLHRLMSEDPRGRTMLYWEANEPSPAPDPATYTTDPRIARAQRQADMLYRLSPRLATAHEFEATSPEEDNILYANGFRAGFLPFFFDAPDYVRWLDTQDLRSNYAYGRQQLQLMSWKKRADYWVIKAPAHLFAIDALLSAFPDANIVVNHRDPREVIPSLCSLAAGFRGMQVDRLDLRALGAEFVEALGHGPRRAIADRAQADPARFCDVSFPRLVAEPIETVRAICEHFGYDFCPEYEAKARRYLAENPRHKRGAHRYALEDFGLDGPTVDHHFADYRRWLADRPELGFDRIRSEVEAERARANLESVDA